MLLMGGVLSFQSNREELMPFLSYGYRFGGGVILQPSCNYEEASHTLRMAE